MQGSWLEVALVVAFCLPAAAETEIERARSLMAARDFAAAMELLRPAAQSGNAEAEGLIGTMYASGLGIPQDDRRAFEWFLRAAMKGHPGAQSAVAWFYESGRGLQEPDQVRAYAWYGLAEIGGEADAAASREAIGKEMTPDELGHAQTLISDYRAFLYPFGPDQVGTGTDTVQ